MPRKRRGPSASSGSRMVSQFQISKSTLSSRTGSSTYKVNYLRIVVTSTSWSADDGSGSVVTPTYDDAPNLGTIYFADVVHGLGLSATAIQYSDANSRVRHNFTDQITLNSTTTRIWLQSAPSGDVSILFLS